MENINILQRKQTRLAPTQAGMPIGMVPPQAVEVEKSVLGAMMLDNDLIYKCLDNFHEGLFYKAEHQVICEAIRKLATSCHEIDLLTVVEELRRIGKLEAAGGTTKEGT